MFFRNLIFFAFPANHAGLFNTRLQDDFDDLQGALDECRLKPVGPLELSSSGFISPLGRDCEALTHRLGQTCWITVGGEDRLLPLAVVNDLLAKKLDELRAKTHRQPSGRTRRDIKNELIVDLLPRAFVSPSRIDAYFDFARNFIVVDSASRRAAENVVGEIRRAAGSFPAMPLQADDAPRAILTGWLAGSALPDGLSLGDECELRDPAEHGAVVKCQRMELQGDEISKHLESGKQCTRLALVYRDHVSFVLGEDLVIRKFKLLDGALDTLDDVSDSEDLRVELNARFALLSGEIGELFDMLAQAFKFHDVGAAGSADPLSRRPPPAAPASPSSRSGRGAETVTLTAPGGRRVTLTAVEVPE